MVREERTVEVTIISGTGLKNLKKFGGEQQCYVVAYIYPNHKQTTPADLYGGVNPTWNTTLTVACYETDLHPAASGASSSSSPSYHLTLEIYSHGGGVFHSSDKLVGTVVVSLQDVVSAAKLGGAMSPFDVNLPSGQQQGRLNLAVKLGAKRELGEYEDLAEAARPSYGASSSGSSSTQFFANDQVPTKQPSSYTSAGQSVSDKGPPTGRNTDPSAQADNFVTGYPAQGYPFAPLGQLPPQRQQADAPQTQQAYDPQRQQAFDPQRQQGYGPGTDGYRPNNAEQRPPVGPIGMLRSRRGQRMGGAGSDDGTGAGQRRPFGPIGMLRSRLGGDGSDGSDGGRSDGGRRRRGPIHLGIMALQAVFEGRSGGQSGAQNQGGFPAQSSQQHWRPQDPNYVPSSASNQQNWRPQNPNYVPSSSSSQQNWTPQDPNNVPSSSSSQQNWRPQDPKYGQPKGQP